MVAHSQPLKEYLEQIKKSAAFRNNNQVAFLSPHKVDEVLEELEFCTRINRPHDLHLWCNILLCQCCVIIEINMCGNMVQPIDQRLYRVGCCIIDFSRFLKLPDWRFVVVQ
jgi:hypothetical protein